MSQKKQDILTTAESLFYLNGFHAVGIKKVIAEANVSLMTLYNHFESKENLVLEVLNQREERYFSFLKQEVSPRANSTFNKLALAHLKWIETTDSKGYLFLRAKEEYAKENTEVAQRVDTHKRMLLDFFEEMGLSSSEALRLALLTEGATALAETTSIETVKAEFLTLVESTSKS